MKSEIDGDREWAKIIEKASTKDPANKFMAYVALTFGSALLAWAVTRSLADIAALEISLETAGLLIVGMLLLLLSSTLSRRS